MNIYEYLGMPSRGEKVTQLVKHWDDVPMSKKAFPYYAQVKKDGVHCIVVKLDGVAKLFTRTGKPMTNVGKFEESCLPWKDGVYMAELTNSWLSLEELSGAINTSRVNDLDAFTEGAMEHCELYLFDVLTIEEFIGGESPMTYRIRHLRFSRIPTYGANVLPYVTLYNCEEVSAFAQKCIDEGEEGAVFKGHFGWLAGHKGFRQMKIVKGVSYDLICIDYEEGKGKYEGLVANLIFDWKGGRKIKAMLGKGWTHSKAKLMFDCIQQGGSFGSDAHIPMGKMYKVTALQESSKGVLRLPKVGELRIDKETPDVESTYKGGRN